MEHVVASHLTQQAANWHARLTAPDCSTEERLSFERWLAADPAHAQAYAKAERIAALLSCASASQSKPTAKTTESESKFGESRITRPSAAQRLKVLADEALAAYPALPAESQPSRMVAYLCKLSLTKVAAAASFVVLGVLLATQFSSLRAVPKATSYQNTTHRQTQVALADGSTIYLDADSRVTVRLSDKARELTLQEGRAYFSVAHDASRPFSVTAAGTRTVALGTRFEVSLLAAQGVTVTLAQGSVAITPAGSNAWREQLVPGQRLTVRDQGYQRQLDAVNAEQVIAWSTGKLVFDGEPLSEVLAQFNRYADDRLILGDIALADKPVGGSFTLGGNSNDFVEALSAVMSLRSERVGEHEIVLFQNHTTAGSH